MKKMKVSSVVNIHLRPDIHLLLANEKTRSLFIEFCKDNFAYETIRCYFAIKEFKKLINASNNNNNKLFNSVTPNDNNNYSTTNTFLINIDNNNNNNTTTTSIDNHNTENNTIIDTNYNNLLNNNQLNNNKTEEEELKILQKIVELYIEEGSEFEINIDSQTRRKVIFQITNYTNFLTINGLTFKENIFSEVEFQILLILNGDILPRFVRSQTWHEFILENGDIATECCSLEDLELLKNLRYTKEDMKRKEITMKEIQFADMVCLDYSCFEYLVGSKDFNAFYCSGDTFFEDLGLGKSNVVKAIGYLPFCAEVVIASISDSSTTLKVLPTTVYDTNENGEAFSYNEEIISATINTNNNNNNNTIKTMNTNIHSKKEKLIGIIEEEEKEEEKEKEQVNNSVLCGNLPYSTAKYHVNMGSVFKLRTCHVACSTGVYFNSKYYYITKSIFDPELYPRNEYIYYKNGKRYCKSTVAMATLSVHVITPISKEKCHYIHFAYGSIGGVLTKMTTLKVFAKLLGRIAQKSRESWIRVINEHKLKKYVDLREGYERVRKTSDNFCKVFGELLKTKECPFPKTFEEFQEL